MGLLSARVEKSIRDGYTFQETYLRYQGKHGLEPRILWAKQREIIEAVDKHDVVAVAGCHASGKTFTAAGIAINWIVKHPTGKVYIIAPTLRQVKAFVAEIELARRDMRECFIKTHLVECTTTGMEIGPDRFIKGFSASKGVNVQGPHGQDVLIICDEAPGIMSEVWDAIEGMRSGGRVHVLKLGNPVIPSGVFFDDFSRNKAVVKGISISAFDTPNLQNKKTGKPFTIEELKNLSPDELAFNPYPFLVTRKWVLERYIIWGPNHPKYLSRVLGQFPSQSEWSVFSLEVIESMKRDPTDAELQAAGDSDDPSFIRIGIDVAGGGDDETSLCARVDGICLKQKHYTERNPGGAIISDLREIRDEYKDLYPMGTIVLDIVGVGLNLAPIIADAGYHVVGFQAGARPRDSEQFENAKSEAFWAVRESAQEGEISGLNDEETEAQLSTIQYKETHRGKTQIESKEDARKRGVQSPDRAEGFIQAYMPMIPREVRIEYGGEYEATPY